MKRREAMLALLAIAGTTRAYGQPAKAPRIALVDLGEPIANMAEGRHPFWGSLLAELRRLDYVEGQSITIERWSGGGASSAGAYSAMASKIVASRPRLIVVRSRSALAPIAAATKEIPIVAVASIPVELRASLARPGTNVTGIHYSFDAQQLYGKQIEVLGGILKPSARIVWLGTRISWESIVGEAARKAAAAGGITLIPVFPESPVNKPTLRRAFAQIAQAKPDGVLIAPTTELFPYREILAELAAAQNLPSLGNGRQWAEAGALLSYGADIEQMWRRAAYYVDKILKGGDPALIPIEQPTKVELVINLETAKSIGVGIPQTMLLRADKVIE